MSSTPVFDAASTSITSIKRPASISLQLEHSLHGLEETPLSQLSDLAKSLANVVLPTPLVPVNRYA